MLKEYRHDNPSRYNVYVSDMNLHDTNVKCILGIKHKYDT